MSLVVARSRRRAEVGAVGEGALGADDAGDELQPPREPPRAEDIGVRRMRARYDRSRRRAAPTAAATLPRGPRAVLASPQSHRRARRHRQARTGVLARLPSPRRAVGDVAAARRRRRRPLLEHVLAPAPSWWRMLHGVRAFVGALDAR